MRDNVMSVIEHPSVARQSRHTRKRSGAMFATGALEELCSQLHPGDRLPTHTELMSRFEVSERAIRNALDDLQRRGRIVRRNGIGTFIVDPLRVETVSNENKPLQRTVVAVTRPDRSYFDRCMDLLFRHTDEAGVSLICQPISGRVEEVRLPVTLEGVPLGYIFFGSSLLPLAEELYRQGNRVVLIGAPPAGVIPIVPCICNDHLYGGVIVTQHLIELGHRRIAYIDVESGQLTQQQRWRGHEQALRDAERKGVHIRSIMLGESEVSKWATEPAQVAAFFRAPDAPTALVAWNDHEAARFLAYLTRAGIRVPEEVSLVGYDALPEGELVYPALTTVEHSTDIQLRRAVEMFVNPEPTPAPYMVVIVPKLLPRSSTGLRISHEAKEERLSCL